MKRLGKWRFIIAKKRGVMSINLEAPVIVNTIYHYYCGEYSDFTAESKGSHCWTRRMQGTNSFNIFG